VYTLGELAERIGARVTGDPSTQIIGVCSLELPKPGCISFLTQPRYRKHLENTSAAAVIIRQTDQEYCSVSALVCDNPYVAYARITALFDKQGNSNNTVDETAVIDPSSTIGEGVSIGAHSVIGAGVKIGDGTRIYPNVTIYHDCLIGRNVTIHSGAVIGSDGFGFANEAGRWIKIYQLGRVVVGDDVEIGANTSIDRGAIEDTVIGNNVIIDNQVQIAHNVRIGDHTAIAGCVGIAGSAVIGKHCALGGGAGILGHLEIVDGVTVTAMSLVTNSIKEPGVYSAGTPLEPKSHWQKNYVRFKQLDDMARRLKMLENELKQLTDKG